MNDWRNSNYEDHDKDWQDRLDREYAKELFIDRSERTPQFDGLDDIDIHGGSHLRAVGNADVLHGDAEVTK